MSGLAIFCFVLFILYIAHLLHKGIVQAIEIMKKEILQEIDYRIGEAPSPSKNVNKRLEKMEERQLSQSDLLYEIKHQVSR